MMQNKEQEVVQAAAKILRSGGVIAYPTESVYGFGCNPLDEEAVKRLLEIKQRPLGKGFILVASNMRQLKPYIGQIPARMLALVESSWPGPYTWVFPATLDVPLWVSGTLPTIAVRISDHPLVCALCDEFGGAIISTSANRSGQVPTNRYLTTQMSFGHEVDLVIDGKVGDRQKPTEIRDAVTGEVLREG